MFEVVANFGDHGGTFGPFRSREAAENCLIGLTHRADLVEAHVQPVATDDRIYYRVEFTSPAPDADIDWQSMRTVDTVSSH